MNAPTPEERMDNLDKIVEPLRELPDRMTRVEEQIVQLRTEMRVEFSAIRRDMATKEDLSKYATKDDIAKFATKDDIAKFATKDEMRMLHEDLVDRLKVLGEAWSSPKSTPRSKKTS